MHLLRDAITAGHLSLDLACDGLDEIFEHVLDCMMAADLIPAESRQGILTKLLDNEKITNSALGHSVAIPHVYTDDLEEPVIYVVRLKKAINLEAADGVTTRFFFFMLGPKNASGTHLDTLANIAALVGDDEFRYAIGKCETKEEFVSAIDEFDSRHPVPNRTESAKTPGPSKNTGLEFTGKIFGGVRGDIARRLPHYWNDFTDGFHIKCFASMLFLFFACLAPAVLFGGLMGDATGDQIGVIEMILAVAICGMVYALFSGTPLIILGGTGPMLIFTGILFLQCERWGEPFLPIYAWVGIWSSIFLLVVTMFDGSSLMRYFTRFTDEIFAALISTIFIIEAINSVIDVFRDPETTTLAEPLLAVILAFGTYSVAMSLSRLRRSDFLRPQLRQILSDFGPAIALGIMSLIAVFARDSVPQDFLKAPQEFGTTSGRPWLVDIGEVSVVARFVAIIPAIFLTVLIFLNQNIPARLVNSPDHHLHKGVSYHLDLGLIGIMMAGCSVFGLPWQCAATVRSLNHVRSLATVEVQIDRSGHSHERVIHVRENRLTGFVIHLTIGIILLLMLDKLQFIPKSTLYGLFLFMGVVSMSGNQFFARASLWIRDPALYPSTHYMRRVPQSVIHIFTAFQAVCLGILWIVKASALGILFPVFIALLVPVRMLAGKYFSDQHLQALDSQEAPEDETTHYSG
ncbi:MAG: PTS sugar transporter subunit IIA [Planctomycetota bacterium]|nr:PTS sugar transporter subunit IIA [Planctomycetota bacterium]